MASVRIGHITLEAGSMEEVGMIEHAVAVLRDSVIMETRRIEMIKQIEALIEDFVDQFGAITIEGTVDEGTGEIIPIDNIKIVRGMNVFCE